MTAVVLTARTDETLRDAAARMAERHVGSTVVRGEGEGAVAGVLTEGEVLRAVADGVDPGTAAIGDHVTEAVTAVRPGTSLEDAAAMLLRSGSRHLVVTDDAGEPVGVLSARDILRVWVSEHLPAM